MRYIIFDDCHMKSFLWWVGMGKAGNRRDPGIMSERVLRGLESTRSRLHVCCLYPRLGVSA